MKNIIIAIVVMFSAFGCSSQKTTANAESQPPQQRQQPPRQGEKGERPSPDEMFSKMDANNDEKLSETEVKGPLKRDFSKIDTDGDGFITRTELENAPKPERGQRPPRNN